MHIFSITTEKLTIKTKASMPSLFNAASTNWQEMLSVGVLNYLTPYLLSTDGIYQVLKFFLIRDKNTSSAPGP